MKLVRTGLAAEAAAAAAFVALHVLRRDLDPLRTPLSFYALGEWGWLFAAGCAAMAAAVAALALVLRDAGRPPRVASANLITAAVALLVIALFPTDPWMPWDRGPTAAGAVHNTAFVVLVAGFGLAGWALARTPSPARRTLMLLGIGFGLILAVTLAAIAVVLAAGGTPGFVGLAERVMFAVAAWWVARALSSHATVAV